MMLAIITALHLACLSQIESGDNDLAVGRQGEVTRYQISPANWQHGLCGFQTLTSSPHDPHLALIVAYDIWERRAFAFYLRHDRKPTARELYLLWNCPADVLKPSKREAERAERFENLVNRK